MNTAKTNYDAAAEKAQKDLTTAKGSAVKAVSDTGTEQVNKVTQTGTEKVTEVTSEGTKQVGLVRDAAEPFLTDTENLKRNADRVNAMIGLLSLTDKVYSVDIPLWETTQAGNCIKSDDNAGLVAYPSTATEHRQNDYEDLPWFKTIDVNAIVDDDGIKRITAIKGDDNYSETGDADVFVCGMAYYEKWSDLGNGYMRYSRCFTPREGYELNKMAYNADGSTNPFFLIAKYPLTKGDDGKMHSQPNRRPAYYTQLTGSENISMNDSINHMKKRGKYYSLGTYFDNGYIQTTWYLMFGDINSDKTMNGCTGGHNFQYVASIESDELNTYFPVTNSQANSIEVGSYVSVGHEYVNGTSRANDRYAKQVHEIAMDVKVLKKEAIDDNNTAIYLDCDPFATTHQTSGDLELRCIMSSMHWWTGFSKDVKGRGQIYGKRTIERWIRKDPFATKYYCKEDIYHYYPSIPHDKLKKLLRRDIKNDAIIKVIYRLIDTYDEGLCIGSYLCQYLANYYLSYAWHYIDNNCYTYRRGKRINYVSKKLFYMDDIILFSSNLKNLRKARKMLHNYLKNDLGIRFKSDNNYHRGDERVDMMGYKISRSHTTIRKRNWKRIRRLLIRYKNQNRNMTEEVARKLISYNGMIVNSNSTKIKKKYNAVRTINRAKGVIKK